jgi:glycerophosphoryl diester phosphodiesterase
MKSVFFDPPQPRLFGHRGNSFDYPENTLPAFADALTSGTPYLELDIRTCKDGQVVVIHDETLLRTCGVNRPVTDLSLTDLQNCDAGATFTPDDGQTYPHRGRGIKVPTLEEVFHAFPEALFNIEIKQQMPAMETALLELIQRTGKTARVLLAAENDTVMNRLRPLCKTLEIPTSFSYGELVTFFAWLQSGGREDYHPPAQALQIPETYEGKSLVTPQTVAAAHALGLEMHVWTVNETSDMERLLSMGVDGLMSDRPALLRQTAARMLSRLT